MYFFRNKKLLAYLLGTCLLFSSFSFASAKEDIVQPQILTTETPAADTTSHGENSTPIETTSIEETPLVTESTTEMTPQLPLSKTLTVVGLAERQSYTIDRGEACRYIIETYTNLTGKDIAPVSENPFTDVAGSHLPYILQANALGIVNGKEEGIFAPSEPLSRGEFAILLYRLLQTAYPDGDFSGGESIVFPESVSKAETVPLQFAYSRGFLRAQQNGTLGAKEDITLGEVVQGLESVLQTAPNFPIKHTTFASKVAFLTFDDGTSQNTTAILDILKQYNVKATFFVTGECDADLLKRMQAEGHVIGNHTYSHKYDTLYASPEAFWADFEKEQQYLKNILGEASPFLRFPGGSNNSVGMRNGVMKKITAQAAEKGYFYVDWNIDSGDARGNNVPKDTLVSNVLNTTNNKKQIVILMHQTKPKTTTVQALPEIIEGLQAQGYALQPLTADAFLPQFI